MLMPPSSPLPFPGPNDEEVPPPLPAFLRAPRTTMMQIITITMMTTRPPTAKPAMAAVLVAEPPAPPLEAGVSGGTKGG